MNLYVERDLDELEHGFVFADDLRGKTLLVTGGTGLIGSLLLQFLCRLNDNKNLGMHVIGVARNEDKANRLGLNADWIICDLEEPILYNDSVDYIIHTASPTQSQFLAKHPVEVIEQTVNGACNILRFAREHNTKSLVYLSSVEVYGQNYTDAPLKEDELGHIDNLNPRSSYSEGKRLIECLCSSYYHQYGVDVRIARLTQTFGCGIQRDDNRVFAQFIRSAIGGSDIVLHTTGESAKSYIYTTDAINAIFFILMRGAGGEAYNVANADSYMSIREMAEFVRDRFNPDIRVTVELNDNMGYAPSTKTNLDVSKLMGLGWSPTVQFDEMYQRTIGYCKCQD